MALVDAARRSIHHVMPRVTSFSLPLSPVPLLLTVCLPGPLFPLLVLSFSVSIIVCFHASFSLFPPDALVSTRLLALSCNPLQPSPPPTTSLHPHPPSSPPRFFRTLDSSLCPVSPPPSLSFSLLVCLPV